MTGVASRPEVGILVISSALPAAPSAVSAAIRSNSSVLQVRTGPSWPWNTPVTRASALVVVGADWLVSKVTVILLIVGHRPVCQPFPAGDLLCLPQRSPAAIFPDSPNTTMACIPATPRGWSAGQLHTGISRRGTISLVEHQRSLTMFLLT